jgi:hypothetical protein
MRQHKHIRLLADTFGIVFDGAVDYMSSSEGLLWKQRVLAGDAAPPNALQPQMITVGNAGIPAYLANYVDPDLTRVLTAPLNSVEIFGEAKKGDWTTMTATFPMIESSGQVSSYGDYNNGGSVDANVNFEPRQSYHYQAFTRWGDRELEMMGLGKIDWAAEQNIATALTFNTFQNKSYFYGIAGLDNYGWLNDPSLNAPIAATGVWSGLTGVQIWTDIQRIFRQLQTQLDGNLNMSDKMTLVLSPLVQPFLLTPMSAVGVTGNTSVEDYLKKAMPNCTVKTAPQYSTASGELIQLFVEQVQGQKLGFCAFTEKMRAHAIVRETSSTHQKKSAGTWGAVLKLPAAIAQLIGA